MCFCMFACKAKDKYWSTSNTCAATLSHFFHQWLEFTVVIPAPSNLHLIFCVTIVCRRLAGLRKEDIYNNLRVPDQFQTTKDDINIIILTGRCLQKYIPVFCLMWWIWYTVNALLPFSLLQQDVFSFLKGHGLFCIDVKSWRGLVTSHSQTWQVRVKEEDQNFINTCIEQIEDPIKALMVMKRAVTSVLSVMWTCGYVKLNVKCSSTVLFKVRLGVPHIVFI